MTVPTSLWPAAPTACTWARRTCRSARRARSWATNGSSASPRTPPSRWTPRLLQTPTTSPSVPSTPRPPSRGGRRSGWSWCATRRRSGPGSRGSPSAASTRTTSPRWPRPAPPASSSCAPSATLPTRAPRLPRSGSRKRMSAEPRRKRKQGHGGVTVMSRQERTEAKNAAARAALEPLEEGERPTVVTIAAAVATLLALGNVIAYAAGLKVQGDRPAIATVAFQALLMGSLAWGMWRARYWAVLGMEAVLAILIVILGVLLLKASNGATVLILLAVIAPAGALFWKLVKAMARLQMPPEH